jgi:hypothetical protein
MATPDGDVEAQQKGERATSPTWVCNLDFTELVGADADWNESIWDLNRAAWWWKNHPYKQLCTYYNRFARKKVFKVFYSMSKEREKYLHAMADFF